MSDNAEKMYEMWAKRRQRSQGTQKTARHAGRRRHFAKLQQKSPSMSPTKKQGAQAARASSVRPPRQPRARQQPSVNTRRVASGISGNTNDHRHSSHSDGNDSDGDTSSDSDCDHSPSSGVPGSKDDDLDHDSFPLIQLHLLPDISTGILEKSLQELGPLLDSLRSANDDDIQSTLYQYAEKQRVAIRDTLAERAATEQRAKPRRHSKAATALERQKQTTRRRQGPSDAAVGSEVDDRIREAARVLAGTAPRDLSSYASLTRRPHSYHGDGSEPMFPRAQTDASFASSSTAGGTRIVKSSQSRRTMTVASPTILSPKAAGTSSSKARQTGRGDNWVMKRVQKPFVVSSGVNSPGRASTKTKLKKSKHLKDKKPSNEKPKYINYLRGDGGASWSRKPKQTTDAEKNRGSPSAEKIQPSDPSEKSKSAVSVSDSSGNAHQTDMDLAAKPDGDREVRPDADCAAKHDAESALSAPDDATDADDGDNVNANASVDDAADLNDEESEPIGGATASNDACNAATSGIDATAVNDPDGAGVNSDGVGAGDAPHNSTAGTTRDNHAGDGVTDAGADEPATSDTDAAGDSKAYAGTSTVHDDDGSVPVSASSDNDGQRRGEGADIVESTVGITSAVEACKMESPSGEDAVDSRQETMAQHKTTDDMSQASHHKTDANDSIHNLSDEVTHAGDTSDNSATPDDVVPSHRDTVTPLPSSGGSTEAPIIPELVCDNASSESVHDESPTEGGVGERVNIDNGQPSAAFEVENPSPADDEASESSDSFLSDGFEYDDNGRRIENETVDKAETLSTVAVGEVEREEGAVQEGAPDVDRTTLSVQERPTKAVENLEEVYPHVGTMFAATRNRYLDPHSYGAVANDQVRSETTPFTAHAVCLHVTFRLIFLFV